MTSCGTAARAQATTDLRSRLQSIKGNLQCSMKMQRSRHESEEWLNAWFPIAAATLEKEHRPWRSDHRRCAVCDTTFSSRTKLFEHLWDKKHAVHGMRPARNDAELLARTVAMNWDSPVKILEAVKGARETRWNTAHTFSNVGYLETGESLLWLATAASVLHPCEETQKAVELIRTWGAKLEQEAPEWVTRTGCRRKQTSELFQLPPLPYKSALELAQAFESYATLAALLELPSGYAGEICPVHLCASVWCAQSVDTIELEAAACGHACCLGGWQGWVHEQSTEHGRTLGGPGKHLVCMQCEAPLSYEDVKRLTRRDAALFEAVERRTVEAALAQMGGFRWCPKGCSSGGWWDAASSTLTECLTRECANCQHRWCSECKRPESQHRRGHEWLPCNKVEEVLLCQWKRQNKHTVKKCTKCGALTEHNGGCSHMRCRCGYEWCWLCERRYQGRYVSLTGKPDQKCSCPAIKGGDGSSEALGAG